MEETVLHITRDATKKALAEARFSAEKVKDVSNTVLSASTEAAEEAGSHIKEVVNGAVQGTREGINTAIEAAKEALSATGDKAKVFVREDMAGPKSRSLCNRTGRPRNHKDFAS